MAHWNKRAHDLKHYLKVRDSEEFRRKRRALNHRNAKAEYFYKYRDKNREKYRAHQAVCYAIRVGKLVRPEHCEACGIKPVPRSDGRSGLHAHHADYAKKLEVMWLCASCHGLHRRKL